MKKTFFHAIFIFFLFFSFQSFGQLFPPSSISVTLEAQVDSTFQLDPAMMDSSAIATIPHTIGVVVALADTTIVSSVHIKLVNNGTIILDASIPFSQINPCASFR